jgi:hypothetical protein
MSGREAVRGGDQIRDVLSDQHPTLVIILFALFFDHKTNTASDQRRAQDA